MSWHDTSIQVILEFLHELKVSKMHNHVKKSYTIINNPIVLSL